MIVVPYNGIQGEHTFNSIKREINKVLPEDKNMQLVCVGASVGTKFNATGKTKNNTISV